MTAHESKQLKVGDRVIWEKNPEDAGTIIETCYLAVKIKWDNGQTGSLDHRDMRNVSR